MTKQLTYQVRSDAVPEEWSEDGWIPIFETPRYQTEEEAWAAWDAAFDAAFDVSGDREAYARAERYKCRAICVVGVAKR